jgi:DNA-binding LacI/PurR family transcriptional regulator
MSAGISDPTRPDAARELGGLQIIDNRPLAVSLLRPDEFSRLAVSVPGDLSLVAFDDFDLLSLYNPPITSVVQPVRQLGREAGKLLLARMRGDFRRAKHLRLPTELLLRSSIAKPTRRRVADRST